MGVRIVSIDGFTPASDDATQYAVTYHYQTSSLPDWVNTAEMKTAFPKLNDALAPQAGSANLVKSSDGWLVQKAQPASGE